MQYLAHIKYESGTNKRIQTLEDHCKKVGEYASDSLSVCGFSVCGKLAGLLHDMGKGRSGFQKYLEQSAVYEAYQKGYAEQPDFPEPSRGSEIHTFQGCIYLLDKYHDKGDSLADLTSEMIACTIGSHHGLFDCQTLDGKNGFLHRINYDRQRLQYNETVSFFENHISDSQLTDSLFEKAKKEVQNYLQKLGTVADDSENYVWYELSMAVRLLVSTLMYADRRNTAEFCDSFLYPDFKGNWKRDIDIFEDKYSRIEQLKPIDKVRSDISGQCRQFADEPSGIYRLDVPTGGGKTLSSLRYALYHAEKYKKKKIFFVIPLLTILDQNAQTIREYLPDEIILEHHSDVVMEEMDDHELEQYDLMRDRWTAPVIITTMVRILDILFGSKTGDITRMRALCNSIIIFDEVQSVPNKMISLFTGAVNFLSDFCRTDVILCSATQPAFEKTVYPLHLIRKSPVTLTPEQLMAFNRHTYHFLEDGRIMMEEEIARSAQHLSAPGRPLMIVCNTKSEAVIIYTILRDSCREDMVIRHLSAGMCKAHRKKIIDETDMILKDIQSGESQTAFILVTTQIVEAGVDLSFRSVIRLEAGDDNLVQAAGRCNRSGEYGAGDVYMVRIKGEDNRLRNLPDIREAKTSMDDTLALYGRHYEFDPEDSDFISKYYNTLYMRLREEGQTLFPFDYKDQTFRIGNILANELEPSEKNKKYGLNQPFLTAGENFKVFDDNTYTVLVPYGEGEELIDRIKHILAYDGNVPMNLLSEAGDYSVQIYEWQKRKLEENGMLYNIFEDSCGTRGDKIFAVYPAAYNEECGIDTEACFQSTDFIF